MNIVLEYVYFAYAMAPDYPSKIFEDKRSRYNLLMETLAMNP